MQEGKRPIAIGFFFSLGHSTVVVALAIGIAATAAALQTRFESFKSIGSVIGTGVSASFFADHRVSQHRHPAQRVALSSAACVGADALIEENIDMLLAGGGIMTHLFRRLFRLIERSWHMYPLGFLFGLVSIRPRGRTEGISAAEAAKGLSIWSILVFPALFTAGMSLMDTTDGVLMIGAYNWAFVKPIRKLYYNLTITFVSVLVAVVIGGIEALGLIGDKLAWKAVSGTSSARSTTISARWATPSSAFSSSVGRCRWRSTASSATTNSALTPDQSRHFFSPSSFSPGG